MYTLKIKNYQIITKADIQFTPGITLITGKSNNGKSSLFKAFRQLVYNQPGTDFIKHNQSKTTIELTKDDEFTIVYSKSQTDGGKYEVTTPNNNTEVYTKLGSSQLPQIKEITHINKDFNYNFWNQLDKPFLISLSPREQFDLIQNSPHSLTLQQAINNLTQDRKSLQQSQIQQQSQLDLLQSQLSQSQEQITSLPTITGLYTQITELKSQQDLIKSLTSLLQQYNQIDLNPIQLKLNKLKSIPTIPDLQPLIQQFTDTQSQYDQLTKTVKPITDLQQNIQLKGNQLTQVNHILTTQFTHCPLCNQPFHKELHTSN